MKKRLVSTLVLMTLLAGLIPVGLRAEWDPASDQELVRNAEKTVAAFKKADSKIQNYFKQAYGYAVFPTVGKGSLIIGGAHGVGVVYIGGKIVGKATITKISIGAQAGGEAYSELMFFKDKATAQKFREGKTKFEATASATAVTSSAHAGTNWSDGIAVFFKGKGGLIADASMGTQNFSFEPAVQPPQKKKGTGK